MIGIHGAPSVDPDQRPPVPATVRPLAALPAVQLCSVVGVMTDIDDTLTRDGALDPPARMALQALQHAGVPVVAITGRPLGWSLPLLQPGAQAWPLQAVVAENGGVALLRDGDTLLTEYAQDAGTRQRNAGHLARVLQRIVAEVPGAQPARDSPGRVTDIAIDHAEFTHLDPAAIARVVALMRDEGLVATVSSIHVNGWIGSHDKLSAARWMVRRLFGRDLDAERERWLYVGDSTNDQLLFGYFPLAVGVANLLHFAAALHTWPAYLATGERGAGFAEVAAALLAARAP